MYSEEIKLLAVRLHSEGKSYTDIARILNVKRSCAQNLCNYQTSISNKKNGRKPILKKYEKLRIKREISSLQSKCQKVNSPKIKRSCGINASIWTIQRHLRKSGLIYRKAKSIIHLTEKHKAERVRLITSWVTSNHPWCNTIFSDEKCFSLDGPDDWRSYISKTSANSRQKRICGGGSVLVWMMMMPNGLLAYHIIDRKFNSEQYLYLLKRFIVPTINLNFRSPVFYQEDNSPVHKSHKIREFFKASAINVLEWPARSPDLNIIEDVWKILSDLIYDGPQFQKRADLITAIHKAILCVNCQYKSKLFNLYDTVGVRLCKVLLKRGSLFNK